MPVWRKLVVALAAAVLVVLTTAAADPREAHRPPTSPVTDGEFLDDGELLDDFIRERLARTGVPGAAYAVVGPEGVQHSATFGVDGDGRPVTTSTPFLWGSVSKPVTATLVVLLARDGVLDVDDRVVELVPEFGTTDPSTARGTTVRNLLEHTSGLPEGLELTDRYTPGRTPISLVHQVRELDPIGAPGTGFSYSSLNYVVLAAVVERVTGRVFEEVLRERLLDQVGVDSPSDPATAQRLLPPGHRYVLGSAQPFPSRIDPAVRAAGYLTGSLDDLAAFARVHLNDEVLTSAERDLMHRPRGSPGTEAGYALGWRSWNVPGTEFPMVWHGGAAPGHQASVLLLPEQELAVVVLQNAYGPFQESALLDTGWGLAALLVGSEPEQQHGTDRLYAGLLVGLGALVAALAGSTGRALVRRGRPSRPLFTGLVLLAVTGGVLALPRAMGVGLVWTRSTSGPPTWLRC